MAGIRDDKGQMQYSHPIPVTVAVNRTITLTGLTQGDSITGPISFGTSLNFVATKQEYRLVNPTTGAVTSLGTTGPGDSFTYYPGTWHNGTWQVQAVAWDRDDHEIKSAPVTVQIATSRRTVLGGIKAGDTLTTGTAALTASANFSFDQVQYLIDGQPVGMGTSFTWQYGAAQNGSHTLQATFTDKDGTVVKTDPVAFTVAWKPFLTSTGVSPKAVVTTAGVTLGITSNVPLASVTYTVKKADGTTTSTTKGAAESFKWTPLKGSDGTYTLTATAQAADGSTLTAAPVTFKAYTGIIYDKQPLVAKDQYLDLIKTLAPNPYRQLGMSQAIQIAQAIHETGWGQSIPVDKYTGQFSYNLFGIKGAGSAGSVTITTWEVYNGVKVTIDDQFRAYKSVQQAWDDHADFLMVRPWYAPFRAVMTDPIQGAWALKRSGYATDPAYPTKLINIMKQYNLFDLDLIQW
jgi:flagellum-specific peptidoglycan hydrolase FlgJ